MRGESAGRAGPVGRAQARSGGGGFLDDCPLASDGAHGVVGQRVLAPGRAGRCGPTIVAAATRVVWIAGVRVGLVQRVRFGASCEEAVAAVFADLPPSAVPRLLAVDAGIATQKQFAAATARDALTGRLRINCKLRGAPPPRPPSQRGRPPTYGAVLHPGAAQPEVVPDEDFTRPGEKGEVRVRRNTLHFEDDR